MPAIPARDAFRTTASSAEAPPRRAATVSPSDALDLATYAKGLYVGQPGDVRVIPVAADDAEVVTFANHPVGYLPVQVRRVLATGTTASAIVALFD